MNAIKQQESSGDYNATNGDSGAFGAYQFMPETWNDACNKLGLDPNDTSPQNQDKAAYGLMSEYYNTYQDPRKVASMWYSDKPDYTVESDEGNYPTIAKYVQQVMDKMGNNNFDYQAKDASGNPFLKLNVNLRTSNPNEPLNTQGILNIIGQNNPSYKSEVSKEFAYGPDYNKELLGMPQDVAKYIQPVADKLMANKINNIKANVAQQILQNNLSRGTQAIQLVNNSNNIDNKRTYASIMQGLGINIPDNADQYVNSNQLLNNALAQKQQDMQYDLRERQMQSQANNAKMELDFLGKKLGAILSQSNPAIAAEMTQNNNGGLR